MATADFLYLPIFWTRYHLSNNYGKNGLLELQAEVDEVLRLGGRTFTLCQYDDGPKINLGDTRVYLSSRQSNVGIDAPLLASPLPELFKRNHRSNKYLANFAGRPDTHEVRQDLLDLMEGVDGVYSSTKPLHPRKFARLLRESEITLAPRGYGGSSFRFFEAIQCGSIPWLIGDVDTRPFKDDLDWDRGSFYSSSVEEFQEMFSRLGKFDLSEMAEFVSNELAPNLRFGTWNKFLIRDLSRTLDA